MLPFYTIAVKVKNAKHSILYNCCESESEKCQILECGS